MFIVEWRRSEPLQQYTIGYPNWNETPPTRYQDPNWPRLSITAQHGQ